MHKLMTLSVLLPTLILSGCAQPLAPRVPIIREGDGPPPELIAQANKLREAGKLLAMDDVKAQLDRHSCRLTLPQPRSRPLSPTDIWNVARRAHIRVGYLFLCNKCNHWHLNIAGGYAITANGAVATCFHVVEPREMKEGYLVAATDTGTVMPVTKILAADKFTDVCIVQVQSKIPLKPLPLCAKVTPGDDVWCYSDPANHRGFFSKGIVNRVYQHWHGPKAKDKFPVRLNVSVEWAPGSSGAAVLDRFGNVVGHVSTISPHAGHPPSAAATRPSTGRGETVIVFHDAVLAGDVIALTKK